MVITSKYNGTCKKCRGSISVGEKINWERGAGSSHIECPKELKEGIHIGGGEGYGYRPYKIGEVLRDRDHKEKILFVLSTSKHYYREDGMSFGVGDDSGYIFSAVCREATEEEALPLLQKESEMENVKAAKKSKQEISEKIKSTGENPAEQPNGEKILDTQDIYGGGDWFVIGETEIWYIQNNGMDGDNWAYNNVHTGGAGAIGWKINFDKSIADELRKIAEVLK